MMLHLRLCMKTEHNSPIFELYFIFIELYSIELIFKRYGPLRKNLNVKLTSRLVAPNKPYSGLGISATSSS
jgi:hypothetical protein